MAVCATVRPFQRAAARKVCFSRRSTLLAPVNPVPAQLLDHTHIDAACALEPVRDTRCRVATSADEGSSGMLDNLTNLLMLGGFFGAWYGFTIIFNIYNKQLLKMWMFPLTATSFQFLVGGVIGLSWFAITGRKIVLKKEILRAVLPLAIVHVLANTLTNLSLGLMAVSFTHTIKAMEPFFSVILSAVFLGDRPHPLVLLTLVPIIGGVIGASFTEATFSWLGFAAAMGSNVSLCFRNVLSKRFMTPEVKELLGGPIGLFSMITVMAFFILAPVAVLVEGVQLSPAAFAAHGVSARDVLSLVTITALCFHAYQQVSYMVLSRVAPVTHSIGNCVKRVVVIVASVVMLQNPMSTQSAVSTGVALAGVFAYSQVKRLTSAKKKLA